MPEITNAAFFAQGTLTIGVDGYKAAIESAILTPTTPTETFRDIGGGIQVIAGPPAWALAIGLAQDWATEDSLSQYLIANQGLKKPVVFTPQAGGKGFTITVLIVAAPIGGAGGAVAKSTVTLLCDGQPTIA